MDEWILDEEENHKNSVFFNFMNKEIGLNSCYMRAAVKWDGCIQINRIDNGTFGDPSDDEDDVTYIHVCDIDEFIEQLKQLKQKTIEHFAKQNRKWPDR